MDDPRISRSYLESLTTGELSRLADRYGIDIPPGLERIFIIEELLDITTDEDADEDAEVSSLRETDFLEPVPLPKQYNITFIELMIRDPLWAFVFWEVKGHDRELYERAPDFAGYLLRVSPAEAPAGVKNTGEEDSFTVPVGIEDNARYLGFPPTGGRYTVALCVKRGEEETVLAASHPFRLPKLFAFPPGEDQGKDRRTANNPLIRLSGAGELPVFRHVDRLSRTLRHPVPQVDNDE